MFKAVLLAAIFTAISALISKADTSEGWQRSPDGETIVLPFLHAPYPHSSRADGHVYQGKMYDREGHYLDSSVGIFIPAGFVPGKDVHYVVHFHGWNNSVAGALKQYRLREQFHEAGRNAVLIVPEGPKNAPDSGGGKLENDPGAFRLLIGEITDYLNTEGKIHTHKVGKIVLSTHSGGYAVTGGILKLGGLTDHITDVLLFDSTYGYLDQFAGWISERKGRRLFSIFTEHLAPENYTLITQLQKLNTDFTARLDTDMTDDGLRKRAALIFHTTTIEHDEIMQKTNLFARLLRTSVLPAQSVRAD